MERLCQSLPVGFLQESTLCSCQALVANEGSVFEWQGFGETAGNKSPGDCMAEC